MPVPTGISIHKALTGLDYGVDKDAIEKAHFNPQGPHGPRRQALPASHALSDISIHKALTGLDSAGVATPKCFNISIHKALTGLDFVRHILRFQVSYFNPQGPHGPRLGADLSLLNRYNISIHKALTGLDLYFLHFG